MCNKMIAVSSITYAIKGRDLLRQKGFGAALERLPAGPGRPGCGYAICVRDDLHGAAQFLQANGIKITDIIG